MSYEINKSWITLKNRYSQEYRRGVTEFISLAQDFINSDGKVKCPCRKCANRFRQTLERLENHLYVNGFQQTYKVWKHHGEDYPPLDLIVNEAEVQENDDDDDGGGGGGGDHNEVIATVLADIEGARVLDGLHRSNDDEPDDDSVQRPSKKCKRGPSRGTNVDKHVQKYGKITIQFDEETGQPYGKWASGFNNAVRQIVRSEISPRTTQWSEVDPQIQTHLVCELLAKFNFDCNNVSIREHIVMQSMNTLRDWRCRLRSHFYAVGGDVNLEEAKKQVSKECDDEDWKWLCDYFSTPEQMAISARNKANRSKKLYPSKQGSKTNVAHRYEMANKQTKELPSMITMFRKMHWSEKTGWSNDIARVHYEEMMEQVSQGKFTIGETSREVPQSSDKIYHEVVGKRSRYKKGIGALPRLKAFEGQKREAEGTYSRSPSSCCQRGSTESAAEIRRLTQKLDHQNTLITSLYDVISRMAPLFGVSVPPLPIFEEPNSPGDSAPSPSQPLASQQGQTPSESSQPQHDTDTSFDPYLS